MNCKSLSNPDNGEVKMTNGTQLGSEAIYSCSPGYRLAGDATRICGVDENWSGSPPDCTLDAVIGSVAAIVFVLSLFLVVMSLIVCCALYHQKKGSKPPVEHVETVELTHQLPPVEHVETVEPTHQLPPVEHVETVEPTHQLPPVEHVETVELTHQPRLWCSLNGNYVINIKTLCSSTNEVENRVEYVFFRKLHT